MSSNLLLSTEYSWLRNQSERIYTPPPDQARLEHFLWELDNGSEPLPPGIHDNKDVIRKWFEERVFIEDEHPISIRDERAQKFTTHQGRVTTFRRLRENVLQDINDLADFIASPVGEATREHLKTRAIDKPATPPQSVDSVTAVGENLPFAEQLAAIKSHDLERDQCQSQHSLTADSPNGQHHNMKSKWGHEVAAGRLVVDEPEIFRKEAANLENAYINRLRGNAFSTTQKKHHVEAPTNTTATTAAATVPTPAQPIANNPNMRSSTRASRLLPIDADETQQPRTQQFGFEPTPQHLQYGVHPGSMYLNSPLANHLPYMAPMQQPWLFQNPTGTFHQPNYPVLQPVAYGYPGQSPYAQDNPGYQGYQQFPVNQQGYIPPPMPSGREVRPPAPGRAARMATLTEAFHTPTSIQGRTLPTKLTQNTEWRNRYSPQPMVVPDLPLLPYRVGSDNPMFPRPTGTASIRFQRLTQDHTPSLHDFALEANSPFIESAKMSKPAEWGVMKIGNVSTSNSTFIAQLTYSL